MTDVSNAEAIATARDYYNSEDADNFYYLVWGGEDLHIGIYESANDSIAAASTRTVARMAELCPNLDAAAKVLDIGAVCRRQLRCRLEPGCHPAQPCPGPGAGRGGAGAAARGLFRVYRPHAGRRLPRGCPATHL